ncbi:MAG TPA: HAMP domain-containing sensor histidine kinase, partial [Candidatus Binatia bacterium]|nr:HAMP domain-containing sensor histidine kinase [Candidatus Binatia bacterium]
LVRPRTAWTAAERRNLADLQPLLDVVLGHVVLRASVAAGREREAAGAAEHERFLNVISHELRNPLAPILMWTSTLRRLRPDDPDVQRAANAIANAVNLERRLIEELLDLSRLERGVLEVVREPVDVRDLVRATVERSAAAAEEAKLTLERELPDGALVVTGDRDRLGQIVAAALENAIKYAPAGGQVRVTLARRGERAELVVTDSGTGFPADVLPRLFGPFVKGRNARGGLGLGLALSHLLVGLHGGTIEAANPSAGGARIVVSLPLAPTA